MARRFRQKRGAVTRDTPGAVRCLGFGEEHYFVRRTADPAVRQCPRCRAQRERVSVAAAEAWAYRVAELEG